MERNLNLKVPEELHAKVKKAAYTSNISMGELVRRAVAEYLKKKGE